MYEKTTKQEAWCSILIPFTKTGEIFKDALSSIQNQTEGGFECILIENYASEVELQIAKQFTDQDSRFTLIHQKEKGIVPALEMGIAHASTDFIVRMDADDFSLPERIAAHKQHFSNNPSLELSATQVFFGGEKSAAGGFNAYVDWQNTLCSKQEIYQARFLESPIAHPSVCFKRSCINQWGSYENGAFPEDYELWLRWMEKGLNIEKIKTPLLLWNDPPDRLSRTDSRYDPDAFMRMKIPYLVREVKKIQAGSKKILVWGAGKKGKKRRKLLEEYGMEVIGNYDLKENIHTVPPTYAYNNLPFNDKMPMIICTVGVPKGREEIRNYLNSQGLSEGKNFIFV